MSKKINKIFNRLKLINNKEYSLKDYSNSLKLSNNIDFYSHQAKTICEQISIIKKQFHNIALIGSNPHLILQNLPSNLIPKNLFLCDISYSQVSRNLDLIKKDSSFIEKNNECKIYPLVIEEEFLCFKPESLDLIISCNNLHWVNDLNICLLRILDTLKPDGAFIGSVIGESTLEELRIAFTLAEQERCGGVSQHIAPFISVTELGNLLTRCNFNMPTVFSEKKEFFFHGCLQLMNYLQNIGENNALLNVRNPTSLKETIFATIAIYDSLFEVQKETNEKKKIVSSTFEDIYFLGWKYHECQQKPKKRGSATFSLKDLTKEMEDIDPKNSKKIQYGEIVEEDDDDLNKRKKKN